MYISDCCILIAVFAVVVVLVYVVYFCCCHMIVVVVLARAVGVPVSRRSGGRLATTLVATINVIISLIFFPIFSPSRPFLIEGVLGSKNLFSESCLECPKT